MHVVAGFSASGSRVTMEGYNLRLLIQEAYNLHDYQLSFKKSNIGATEQSDTYYDIVAVAGGSEAPTRDQIRQMLRDMLAERFNLRAHYEPGELPVYSMVIAKGGTKFKQSSPSAVQSTFHDVHGRNPVLNATKVTMSQLASDIGGSFGVRLPVIDGTGLTGSYDLKLEATPEWSINSDSSADDITIADALQQQLGLKLQPQKASVSILFVDHVERPSEN